MPDTESSTDVSATRVIPSEPETQAVPPPVVTRTRAGTLHLTLITFTLVLLVLLIFILQNGRSVDLHFLGARGHLPLAVAMLLAAVAGALLVAIAGGSRILQLRGAARRHRRSAGEPR